MDGRDQDLYFMRAALTLAAQGVGRTSPNPMVGAIVVKDGKMAGYGRHKQAGGPHAERFALDMAHEQAQGATLYVTLEPCNHQGRTGPCTEAIIEAGISRVVLAMVDPNPLVAGQGIARLQEAGIQVEAGLLEQEAIYLNDIYLKNICKKRTFCALKTAVTLDGKTATASGSSQWITNKQSREQAHLLRSRHDAVLTGIGTVKADDCRLTVRLDDYCGAQPVRIVLDPRLEISPFAQILDAQEVPTWIICDESAITSKKIMQLMAKDAEFHPLPHQDGHVEPRVLLDYLYEQGIMSVMLEAGSRVNRSFFEAGEIDKYYAFVAPKIVGGHEAPSIFSGSGVADMNNALDLKVIKKTFYGDDLFIAAYPK